MRSLTSSLVVSAVLLVVALVALPVVADEVLDLNGVSQLGWPFTTTTGWKHSGFSPGHGDHFGDDWYAQDWNGTCEGGGNCDEGAELRSAISGTVVVAYDKSPDECAPIAPHKVCGYGNQVVILSKDGNFALRYTHLQKVFVKAGAINLGDRIGTLGKSGLTGKAPYTAHLHLVLYKNVSKEAGKECSPWKRKLSILTILQEIHIEKSGYGDIAPCIIEKHPATEFAAQFKLDSSISQSSNATPSITATPHLYIDGTDSSTRLQESAQPFIFTGTGFAGSSAIQYIYKVSTDELLPRTSVSVHHDGTIRWTFPPLCSTPADTYNIEVVSINSDGSQVTSNTVTETIEPNPSCGKPSRPVTPPVSSGQLTARLTISSGSNSIHENQTLNLTIPTGQDSVDVTFDGSASSDPSGQQLAAYEWSFNGVPSGDHATMSLSLGASTYAVMLRVLNAIGVSAEARATVIISAQHVPVTPEQPTTRQNCQSNDLLTFCRTIPTSVQAGASFLVVDTVTAKVDLNIVGIVDALAPGFTLVSGELNSGLPTPLAAGQQKTLAYTLSAGSSSSTISGVAKGLPPSGPSESASLDSPIMVAGGGAPLAIRNSLSVSTLTFSPIGAHSTRFVLTITGHAIASTRLQVFNFQGQAVFESGFQPSSNLYWTALDASGRPLANGVYFYVVTVRGYDGRVITSEVKKVVLLR